MRGDLEIMETEAWGQREGADSEQVYTLCWELHILNTMENQTLGGS